MSQRLPSDFKEITCPTSCLEGVLAELINPADLTKWRVYIQAPTETPFEGGIFETNITFPPEYPMLPPEMIFISEMFHPNVYPDGKVCISILHPPGKDAFNDQERAEERWMPAHTPLSIFNCFMTLLEEPNIYSPANLDASNMWRDRRDEFLNKAKEIVELARKNLPQDIVEKLPKPDTDPLQRARRVKDKLDELPLDDPHYNKRKQQLEKVIYDVLQKLPSKEDAESFYRNLCPQEHLDVDIGGGDEDDLAQNWDSDDGGDECEGFADDDDDM
jgi:ubiquitin-protein ligase